MRPILTKLTTRDGVVERCTEIDARTSVESIIETESMRVEVHMHANGIGSVYTFRRGDLDEPWKRDTVVMIDPNKPSRLRSTVAP